MLHLTRTSTSRLFSILASILLFGSSVLLAANASDVVQTFLSTSEFQSTVIASPSVWMIQFYDGSASTDGVSLVYKEVAAVLNGIIKVGAIDVSIPQQREIADALELKSFPKIFVLGDDKMNPIEHKGNMEPNCSERCWESC